jgi:hypothetical protein
MLNLGQAHDRGLYMVEKLLLQHFNLYGIPMISGGYGYHGEKQ